MAPDKLVERHLSEMVKTGILDRRYPATPTHADHMGKVVFINHGKPC
jgi:hypothetical protein